jgi:hypothetical protein
VLNLKKKEKLIIDNFYAAVVEEGKMVVCSLESK